MAIEELVGPLPHGWEYSTLGEICAKGGGEVQTGPFGSQLHASDYVPDGIPSIMPLNIGDNRIVLDGIARITPEDAERLSRYRVRPGDIVYSRRGDVERRALIRSDEGGWLCGTGCLRVRFGEGYVNPMYASYYLGDKRVREWIVRHAHGATMPNLNTSILSDLPFVVPPADQQTAISDILGALDDKIDLKGRMNATLEMMAQALFKDWFVDFGPTRAKMEAREPYLASELWALFPDRMGSEGKPFGWETVNVSGIAERIAMGPFGSNIKVETFVKNGIPVITGQHLSGTRLEDRGFKFISEEHAKRLGNSNVRRGDIVVTHRGNIGQVAIIPETSRYEQYVISQSQCYLRCDLNKISPLFVTYFFKSHEGQHKLLANTSQVGVPSIARPTTNLKAMEICLPTRPLLLAFDEIVASMHLISGANDIEVETLVAIRDLLLPRLMSGEIQLCEAEKLVKKVS